MKNISRKIIAYCAFMHMIFSASCIVQVERTNSIDAESDSFVGYRVMYNSSNALLGEVPAVERYLEGETVTVAGNTGNLIKTAYSFAGWNTEADMSGITYSAGSEFTMENDAVTLYAAWERWTRLYAPLSGTIVVNGTSVDSYGNCYITGHTDNDLDGEEVSGTADAFIIKYDTSGNKQWTRLLGVDAAGTFSYSIATDRSGNCFIAGVTGGNLDGEVNTGMTDNLFVSKYNSSGVKQWTRLSGVAAGVTPGYGISADDDGNCYVTGYTEGDLDGESLAGARDVYVIKYNTSGVKQWTRLLGIAGGMTYGKGISVDSSGNCYVAGYTDGDLDGQDLSGIIDVFLIKYTPLGIKQWTRLLGIASGSTSGSSISTDRNGNSYITGLTSGDLDGQDLTGAYDVCVIKYDTSGVKQWTRLLGASGQMTTGNSISIDSTGYCYVTGTTYGNLDGQLLTGFADAFVIKYDTSGNKQWTRLMGASSIVTDGKGISTDTSGNCYVACERSALEIFITTGFND